MKRVVLSVGIPGSGKTTVLKALAERHGLAYLSSDGIREELTGSAEEHSQDARVWDTARARAKAALESGGSVVVDATFTNSRTRREFVAFVQGAGAREVIALVFDIPLDIARTRNAGRARVVRDEQLVMRYEHLTKNPPALADGFSALYPIERLAELEALLTSS